MDSIHYTSSVFQYPGIVWWGLLKGRLHFDTSRKRSLARMLSKVKSWGGGYTEVYRKESSEFCPEFGCQSSKLRNRRGECRVLPTGRFICRQFEFSSLQPHHSPLPSFWNTASLIWLFSNEFYFLHIFWKCVLKVNHTFTVSANYLDCYEFITLFFYFFILVRSLEGENHGHVSILFLS